MNKKAFIICTVRKASDGYRKKLEKYVEDLEHRGYDVHLPHRDTEQNQKGLDICKDNLNAIASSGEVHVFYNNESRGTHFDMGVAFALGKPVIIAENEEFDKDKSYARMLEEWAVNGSLNL